MADRRTWRVAAGVLAGAAVFAGGLWLGHGTDGSLPQLALQIPAERLDLGRVGPDPALTWKLPVTNDSRADLLVTLTSREL